MLRISVISVFPEALSGFLATSIVGRARRRGLVEVEVVDPRRWAGGRHRNLDDRPYGGGPGMVMAAPPLADCVDAMRARLGGGRLLMTSPAGRRLDQAMVQCLAAAPTLIVVCGHYEGIDERFVQVMQPEEFSVGDVVLSGGEVAALVLIDAVIRLLPGALGDPESPLSESFGADGLLDHPCYTRPPEFRGLEVPAVLLSGDHAAIKAWRQAERLRRTHERRPDLEQERPRT